MVNLPPTLQPPAPRPAPAQTAQPAPVARPAPVPAPAPVQPVVIETDKQPIVVVEPVPVFVEDPLPTTQPTRPGQPQVITIIGEPGSATQPTGQSGLSDEELLETLFSPQGQTKSPIEPPSPIAVEVPDGGG